MVNDISDKDIGLIKGILDDYDIEDHYLILTSGYLNQNSKIRKLIEEILNHVPLVFILQNLAKEILKTSLNHLK